MPAWLSVAEVTDDCGEVFTEVVFLNEIKGCGHTYTRVYQFRATDEILIHLGIKGNLSQQGQFALVGRPHPFVKAGNDHPTLIVVQSADQLSQAMGGVG